MKKTILLLAVLLGLAGAAQAQTNVKFGFKAGANMSGFTGSDNTDVKSRYGFSAGATLNVALTDLIAIQPELLYSQKGMTLGYAGENSNDGGAFKRSGDVSGTFGQNLTYLDIPVLLRVHTGGNDGSGLFFELGPQASVLLGQEGYIVSGDKATVVLAGPERSSPQQTNEVRAFAVGTSTNDFNSAVLGYVAGFGYQLPGGLSLGIRYTGDISRPYKNASCTAAAFDPYQSFGAKFSNPNVRNSVFQVQAGYTLPHK